jgi:hypothetical protein
MIAANSSHFCADQGEHDRFGQLLQTEWLRAVSSRSDLERLSVALLQSEMPVPKPVRLLGVSLSALQHADDAEPQLALPM